MSSILGSAGLGIRGPTAEDAKRKAFEAVEQLKARKEQTTKAVEEGLGGLKVLLGGKGVAETILEDPIVKKYGQQLKGQAVDAVKKAGQNALDAVTDRLTALFPDGTAGAAASPGAIESVEAYRPQIARLAASAARAREARLQSQLMDSKWEEAQLQTANFGRPQAERYDDWDAPPAYDHPLSSSATTNEAGAPESTASGGDPNGAFAGETQDELPEGTESAAAGAADTATDATGAAAGGAAAGEAVGAEAGEAVGVTAGEAALAALDAIPIVDIFTLAAGAGLAAGAAAKKRRQVAQFKPDPDLAQSGSAFQAGFAEI